jgi:hypothetical protein
VYELLVDKFHSENNVTEISTCDTYIVEIQISTQNSLQQNNYTTTKYNITCTNTCDLSEDIDNFICLQIIVKVEIITKNVNLFSQFKSSIFNL